jgi:hypothetical protein
MLGIGWLAAAGLAAGVQNSSSRVAAGVQNSNRHCAEQQCTAAVCIAGQSTLLLLMT